MEPGGNLAILVLEYRVGGRGGLLDLVLTGFEGERALGLPTPQPPTPITLPLFSRCLRLGCGVGGPSVSSFALSTTENILPDGRFIV